MKKSTIDVIVIGAGPAGTVAAALLHQAGKNVRIIEKQLFPRFVIGESLLPVTMEHLEQAGLLDVVKQGGFQVKKGAQFIRDGKTCLFDFSEQYTKGWTWTWQLPRADFDQLLAQEVMRKGVEVSFETEVTDVQLADGKSILFAKGPDGEEEIHARFIVDCSGYGRVLPRLLNLDKPSTLPPKASLFTHVKDVHRPPGDQGTQITFVVLRQDAWFWTIPFSNGITSLGFVGDPDFFELGDNDSESLFRKLMQQVPEYAEQFRDTEMLFEPKLIHAYSKSIKQLHGPGYVLAGNSAEFLDPVFSSGVAFATGSAVKAAELVVKELKGEPVNWQQEYDDHIMAGVKVFRSFVEGWYNGNLQKVFFSDVLNADIKKQICSLLAGYVWDTTNPVVKRHDRILSTLAHIIDMSQAEKTA